MFDQFLFAFNAPENSPVKLFTEEYSTSPVANCLWARKESNLGVGEGHDELHAGEPG
jgi:hypothetical protein